VRALPPSASREERRAAGKALRDRCSRQSHETWKPAVSRFDPIRALIESSEGRIPELVPIRYGRMMTSAFAFYRGAAAIMAADLARTPATGLRVQACGDCHLLNFGGFATPERHLIFDINDFDETLPAPWEWDVKRLAASFAIAADHNGFANSDALGLAARCVRAYRKHMRRLADLRLLDRWYQRLDLNEIVASMDTDRFKRQIERHIEKASARTILENDFPKLTQFKNGRPAIKDKPPLIFHHTGRAFEEFDAAVKRAFHRYRTTLPNDRKALIDRFEVRDAAAKVVGVGSVGTRCGILLLMAGRDDPLFLQVKEARRSVLEPHVGMSRYDNHGERIVVGQRLMQAASDIFLGWTAVGTKHYYIRQLHDITIKPIVEAIDFAGMLRYADWCGWALARAHAKSGDADAITGYIGRGPRFDDAVARFAVRYAKQNERDHQAMLKAIRAGTIRVVRE